MQSLIQGAGGGKKSNPTPQPVVQQTTVVQQVVQAPPSPSDDANTLFSKSSVRLIDVVSEGEIGVCGQRCRKSIFLDDTASGTRTAQITLSTTISSSAGTRAGLYPRLSKHRSGYQCWCPVGNAVDDSVVRTITDPTLTR